MFLHIDVETTGIPVNGMPSDHAGHPHMASLSAILDQDAGEPLEQMSVLIQPLGYRLEDFPEAFRIHGITTERAMAEGVTLTEAMEQFIGMARRAQTIVAYSAHFDVKLLKIGCARVPDRPQGEAFRQQIESMTSICTMESAAMCLIGKKRMKLKDAYWELFHEQTQTAVHHGSAEDVAASRRVFWELHLRKALVDPKPILRVYDTPAPTEPPVPSKRGARPEAIDEVMPPARRAGKPAAL